MSLSVDEVHVAIIVPLAGASVSLLETLSEQVRLTVVIDLADIISSSPRYGRETSLLLLSTVEQTNPGAFEDCKQF